MQFQEDASFEYNFFYGPLFCRGNLSFDHHVSFNAHLFAIKDAVQNH